MIHHESSKCPDLKEGERERSIAYTDLPKNADIGVAHGLGPGLCALSRASFKFLLPTYCAGQPMHPSPVQPSQTYDVPIKTEERVRVRSTTSIHPIQYVGT